MFCIRNTANNEKIKLGKKEMFYDSIKVRANHYPAVAMV